MKSRQIRIELVTRPESEHLFFVAASVDYGFVLDLPGPVGVSEGVEGLLDVGVGRRHASDHQSVRIPTKRILEKPGQLRITVRDVTLGKESRPRVMSKLI